MKTRLLTGAMIIIAAAACARNTRTITTTTRGDTIISHGNTPLAQVAGTIKSGTTIHAVLQEDVSSSNHKPGDEVRATLTEEVKDVNDRVLFPAGTEAQIRVTQLRAPADDKDNGDIGFAVMGLTNNGQHYTLSSSANPSSYDVRDRGPFDDKGNIAIGAGAGAVAGGLITGSVKGAVLGGLLGGAAGAVYNSQTGKREVVAKSGTKLEFKLERPVVVMIS
jgi:hypothetical protein